MPAGVPTGVATGVLTGDAVGVAGAVVGEGVAVGATVATGLGRGVAGGAPAEAGCRLTAPGLAGICTPVGELLAAGTCEIAPLEVDAGVLVGTGSVVGVRVAAGDSSGTGGRGMLRVETSLGCTTDDGELAGVLWGDIAAEGLLGVAAGDGLETD